MNLSQLYKALDSLARLHERRGASEEAVALLAFRKALVASHPRNLTDLISKLEGIQRVDGDDRTVRNTDIDSLK